MKVWFKIRLIIILIAIITTLSCKAQIVPYESDQNLYVRNSGEYYKDTNNVFNNFSGEWKWEDNTTNSSLTFKFKKEIALNDGNGYTYDLLVGEYQYIENGEELANTLTDIDNSNISGHYHKISGIGTLTKYNHPQCDDCSEEERRMQVIIEHDNYEGVTGKLIMRYLVEDGIEKLYVIVKDGSWLASNPNAPNFIDIPFGSYILIKQD